MPTLRWCLSANFFKAGCKLVSLVALRFPGLVHVKTIAVYIKDVQCLVEGLLKKIRRGKRR